VCSWEDNNKIEWLGTDWIHLALDRSKQHAVANVIVNLQFPLKKKKKKDLHD
jgi:hypothetical protein